MDIATKNSSISADVLRRSKAKTSATKTPSTLQPPKARKPQARIFMQVSEVTPTDKAVVQQGKVMVLKTALGDVVHAQALTREEQTKRSMAYMHRVASGDRKSAVEFLKRAGILDGNGNLAKIYRTA